MAHRRPWVRVVLAGGLSGLLVTGCGAGDTGGAAAPPVRTGTATGTDSGAPAGSGTTPPVSPGAGPPAPTAPLPPRTSSPPTEASPPTTRVPAPATGTPVPRCTADRLRPALGRAEPAAGNLHIPLFLTQTGRTPCALTGYPGVSLLTASGERIGDPATREAVTGRPPVVVLDPGGTAVATLHTVNKGVSDKPCRPPAAGLRVYPPGSTTALRVPAGSFRVCGEVFEVGPVEPAGPAARSGGR